MFSIFRDDVSTHLNLKDTAALIKDGQVAPHSLSKPLYLARPILLALHIVKRPAFESNRSYSFHYLTNLQSLQPLSKERLHYQYISHNIFLGAYNYPQVDSCSERGPAC